ncbi:MaoC family dehydratase [Bosea sp. AS-1]|jgi:acyl dehydratase|uniref:MaoC family dehydratase n=1 Tax=Bosea sp. AS-1 TaxID=2015316 RepID=UPI000B7918D5|nr:MaoC family dehydratase [Bosea sp. AS-1]
MKLHVAIGERAEFRKTIREADLLAFSEITGDHDPIHVDEAYAARSRFGRRIAHGALVMGLLSTTASMISRRAVERGAKGVSVSLGYDRIRFLKPVFIDDTLTASYEIESIDAEKGRSLSKVEVVNQHGEPCLVGTHVMRWLPPEESA